MVNLNFFDQWSPNDCRVKLQFSSAQKKYATAMMVVVFIFSELSDPLDADDAIGRCIMKMWIKYREPLLE